MNKYLRTCVQLFYFHKNRKKQECQLSFSFSFSNYNVLVNFVYVKKIPMVHFDTVWASYSCYPFLLLWLSTKSSSSSLSWMIFFLAFVSPFFELCSGLFELSPLLGGGGGDLIGVPNRSCFCFLCFFSYAFLALSGDSNPCSIILQY